MTAEEAANGCNGAYARMGPETTLNCSTFRNAASAGRMSESPTRAGRTSCVTGLKASLVSMSKTDTGLLVHSNVTLAFYGSDSLT